MTPAANDLFLTTINDGTTYEARKHAAYKLIQGYYNRQTYKHRMRALVNEQAKKSRQDFGSKYKPQEITEAAHNVCEYMAAHALEIIRDRYNPNRQAHATIRRWFDKINGNSYFSVMVQLPQDDDAETLIYIPFQYGYGSHPEWQTVQELISVGILTEKPPGEKHPSAYPIGFEDRGYGFKRDL